MFDRFTHSLHSRFRISLRQGQFVKDKPEDIAVEVRAEGMEWALNDEILIPMKYQTLKL